MIEKKNKYKKGIIEKWNEKKNKEDWRKIKNRKYLEGLKKEKDNMGNLRDLYNKL